MTTPPASLHPPRRPPGPSATRAASNRRQRHVEELLKGNVRALRHGIFAEVLNAADVQTEVALTYAARPLLDPIADRRLVELLSTTNVQRQRCLVAMQRDGLTSQLTAYDSRLAALVERLERAVHDRERERIREARATDRTVDLDRYRPGGVA